MVGDAFKPLGLSHGINQEHIPTPGNQKDRPDPARDKKRRNVISSTECFAHALS